MGQVNNSDRCYKSNNELQILTDFYKNIESKRII